MATIISVLNIKDLDSIYTFSSYIISIELNNNIVSEALNIEDFYSLYRDNQAIITDSNIIYPKANNNITVIEGDSDNIVQITYNNNV